MLFPVRSLIHIRAHQVLRSNFKLGRDFYLRPIFLTQTREMKRKATSPKPTARKAAKVDDYCSVQTKKDSNGDPIWPAPDDQMHAARTFLKEWYAPLEQEQSVVLD